MNWALEYQRNQEISINFVFLKVKKLAAVATTKYILKDIFW
jgi:hypothetical protein